MKKIWLFLLCSFCLMACSKVAVYNFSVNDEKISISIQDELTLKEREDGFSIEAENIDIQGMFIETSTFEIYCASVKQDSSVEILQDTSNQLIWKVEGNSGWEWNCLSKISDQTSVLMGCLSNAESIYKSIVFDVN